MRLLLLTHQDLAHSPGRSESAFVSALAERAHVDIVRWEDLPDASASAASAIAGRAAEGAHDALVMFVRFRHLHEAAQFRWNGFRGLRVWIEHDAWNAFSPAHPHWHGTYQAAFRRHEFHLMVSTGRVTTQRLVDDGVRAVWLPKGYAPETFRDTGGPRSGVCTFGTRWPARRAMVSRVARSGLEVHDVSGPYETLNARLNEHAAGVVCNMPATTPFGRIGRAVRRIRPAFVTLHPAVEPMIKTFEVAGSGCAPIIDEVSDLEDLGFEDGRTCYRYSSLDELIDILRATSDDEYLEVGRAAARLASTQHTWPHRAAGLVDLLEAELTG